MKYNLDFDLASVVIWMFMLFFIFYKKGLRKRSNIIFLAIVMAGLISTIADIIGTLGNIRIYEHQSYSYADIWNYVFLIFHNSMSYLFVIYIIYLMGVNYKTSRQTKGILMIPGIVTMLILLTNPVLHLAYYFDNQWRYTHGRLMPVLYFNALLYILIAIFVIIKYKKALAGVKFVSLIAFTMISVIPILVQMRFPTVLVEAFFQSIGFLGILLSIENEDEVINPTTLVYNRIALLNNVELAVNTNTRSVILMIKMPNATYYNTTFGIKNMNVIHRQITKYLSAIDKKITCFDCDNGHFALMSYFHSVEEMREIAWEIMNRFDQEWVYHNLSMVFPVQLCVMSTPDDITSIEKLMLVVDTTFDKLGNKSEFIEFSRFGNPQREIRIEKLVRDAIKNKTFQIFYQPIWDRRNNKICSAEALVRLRDEELGYISPDEFIPIAERNGTIIKLGEFVLEEVCKLYSSQHLQELGIDYIDVNLSVVQCMNNQLIKNFEDILEKYHLDASKINLEITESAAVNNQRMLKESVTGLSQKGFQFSLDDYGTGYSNFTYMFGMPFSTIKLDKSILWSALDPKTGVRDQNAMMFLETTVKMMRQMNYQIVVEGVETKEQKRILEQFSCDYIQGYYFSKPVPADVFIDYIKKANAM